MTPDEMESNYDKAQAALNKLTIARTSMDKLTSMGENVSMGDLVKAGGRLVASGLDATSVAGLLADAGAEASDNPKLLAEWVKHQDIELHQREAQLKLATRDLAYHMGLTGVQMIAKGMGQMGGPLGASGGGPDPSASPPPLSNPLMPSPETPNG